jgi:hypothetical protein
MPERLPVTRKPVRKVCEPVGSECGMPERLGSEPGNCASVQERANAKHGHERRQQVSGTTDEQAPND